MGFEQNSCTNWVVILHFLDMDCDEATYWRSKKEHGSQPEFLARTNSPRRNTFSLERTLQVVDLQAREGPHSSKQIIRSSDPRDFISVLIGNMFLFSINLYVWILIILGTPSTSLSLLKDSVATLELTSLPSLDWELFERFFRVLQQRNLGWMFRKRISSILHCWLYVALWEASKCDWLKHGEGERRVIGKTIAVFRLSCNWERFNESL